MGGEDRWAARIGRRRGWVGGEDRWAARMGGRPGWRRFLAHVSEKSFLAS